LKHRNQWVWMVGWLAVWLWVGATAWAAPVLEEVQFYYRMDAEARYYVLRSAWQQEHSGAFTVEAAEKLALQAFDAASVEKKLKAWRERGGPRPPIFYAKAYVRNPSKEAVLNTHLRVETRVHSGELRVDPQVLMTDYRYLRQTAQWHSVSEETVSIPVLAPGEETLVKVAWFEVFRFLRKQPDLWPWQVEVTVSLLPEGSEKAGKPKATLETQRVRLRLIPDHFLLPEAYRY